MTLTTRFAPSPTGPLHLGHAYSALIAQGLAEAAGGTFLLRIDDLDQTRARPEWEQQIKADLAWLGLDWPEPCRRESEHMAAYDAALDALWRRGLLYPCHCSRRDIRDALSAPQEGALCMGPDGLIYPGTCRPEPQASRAPQSDAPRPRGVTLRLNMAVACALLPTPAPLGFEETGRGPNGESGWIAVTEAHLRHDVGDVVLARKDFGAAYHLAVVIDDAAQAVTHVVRGEDLFTATAIHVLLQALMGLPSPIYRHHDLIRDETGKRLAKRDDARALATYRDEGRTPTQVRALLGL